MLDCLGFHTWQISCRVNMLCSSAYASLHLNLQVDRLIMIFLQLWSETSNSKCKMELEQELFNFLKTYCGEINSEGGKDILKTVELPAESKLLLVQPQVLDASVYSDSENQKALNIVKKLRAFHLLVRIQELHIVESPTQILTCKIHRIRITIF